MQSRKMSFVESWTNVAIGYGINFMGQLFIYPLVGIEAHLRQNLIIGGFFTVISVIRSYCLRRWFNKKVQKQSTIRLPYGRAYHHGQKPRA